MSLFACRTSEFELRTFLSVNRVLEFRTSKFERTPQIPFEVQNLNASSASGRQNPTSSKIKLERRYLERSFEVRGTRKSDLFPDDLRHWSSSTNDANSDVLSAAIFHPNANYRRDTVSDKFSWTPSVDCKLGVRCVTLYQSGPVLRVLTENVLWFKG